MHIRSLWTYITKLQNYCSKNLFVSLQIINNKYIYKTALFRYLLLNKLTSCLISQVFNFTIKFLYIFFLLNLLNLSFIIIIISRKILNKINNEISNRNK